MGPRVTPPSAGECLNHAAAHAAVQPEPSAFPAIFHAQEARLEDGDGGGQALGLPQGRFTLPDAGQWDKQARYGTAPAAVGLCGRVNSCTGACV